MDPTADPDTLALLAHLLVADDPATGRVPDAAWPAIAAAARDRNLGPLLYRRFGAAAPPGSAAADALAPLRPRYLHTLGANLRAKDQLAAIADAFAARGIPAALLKGAHLAFSVCGDPGDRPMSDLDLLVEPSRVADAAAALRVIGLAPEGDRGADALLEGMAHLPPFAAPGKHPVELHWRLLRPGEPYRIDVAALLARARPLPEVAPAARPLEPADAFLHLALHAIVKDRLAGGLRPLVDVALLFAATAADPSWAEAAARARGAGAARVHDLALALVGAAFGDAAPLPSGLARAGEAPDPQILAAALALAREAPAADTPIAPNLARALAGPPGGAARLVVSRLFPSRDELDALEGGTPRRGPYLLRLPRRWVTLLSRHGAHAWRLLRRDDAEREQAGRSERGRAVAAWCAGGVRP
jgi:hypothetical protein